ncbi:PilC/PilY family type IV pilus protein [Xanthomonadaceae bacterium XH05]|nr:PilC/PilY family type IV pilus protein [Xanthomonadaceae bacterium XH05]
MKTIKSFKAFVLAGLVFSAGLSGQTMAAALDIADRPLFLQAKVPPAFIMAVDDSGSMKFQTLFMGGFDGSVTWGRDSSSGAGNVYSFFRNTGSNKGVLRVATDSNDREFVHVAPYPAPRQTTTLTRDAAIPPIDAFGFTRSHVYNPAYFNPGTTYRPWRYADGSFWSDANPKSARTELNKSSNTRTIDLTAQLEQATSAQADDLRFQVKTGMVLPSGMRYRITGTSTANRCGTSTSNRLPATSTSTWYTLEGDFTATADCNLYIGYFPATFYLPKDDPAPTGYRTGDTYRPIIENACTYRTATGADRCDMRRYEIKPANYTTTAHYNAAIQNFANWFVYYGNRTRSMIAAMSHSLYDVDSMRIGYFTINDRPSGTALEMRNMNELSEKQALFSELFTLDASGNTFNLPAVKTIGDQFRRQDSRAPVRLACQINAGMLFTDGFANQSQSMSAPSGGMGVPFDTIKANSMAAIAAQYYLNSLRPDFLKQDLVPTSPGCNAPGAANNPKLDCKVFPHMNLHGVTLGSVGDLVGVDYGVDEAGNIDSDKALDDVIANPPTWPGYNSGTRSTIDDLWHATIVSRGKFINATTPANITEAMTQILNAVAGRAAVSGGTAASGTRREDGFLAYVPHFDSGGWTGNLKAHSLNANGTLGAVQWDARAKLNAKSISDRKVYFVTAAGAVQEFKADAALPTTTVAALDRAVADLCPGGECTRADVIEYLRGDHSKEARNGGPFRDRLITDIGTGATVPSRIGDILGSQPEVLNKSSYGYSSFPAAMGGSSYNTFLTTTKKNRTQLVFVASNNGMLHAFNAQTGEELWALIPNAVLTDNIGAVRTANNGPSHFVGLAYPEYGHRYFFDGSPVQGDAYINGSWKTVLAAPLGAGGRSMLVLDVTNGGSDTVPKVLSEATHAEMGYGVDRPRIAPFSDNTWRVLFGNGYNSNAHGARLFSVNLATGALSSNTVGGPGAGTLDEPNGMAPVAASDDNQDMLADVVYAGDYKGNLWKFPVTSSGIQNAGSVPLFQARDATGKVQHITGGIDTIMHPRYGQIVYFGTGRYFLNDDRSVLLNPAVESFYAVWDGDGWSAPGTTSVATATYNRSNLVKQTLSAEMAADGKIIRKTSTNPLDWGSKKGWYLELATNGNAQGERFVGVPTVALGLVFFTTFLPNADSDACASSGTNWLNVVDATTGVGGLDVGGQGDVGSYKLPENSSGGGPVGTPPIVVTPPPVGCDPMTDPDCQPPQPDPDGNVNPLGAPECNNDLGILLATGIEVVSQITCGRQSWRQVQ